MSIPITNAPVTTDNFTFKAGDAEFKFTNPTDITTTVTAEGVSDADVNALMARLKDATSGYTMDATITFKKDAEVITFTMKSDSNITRGGGRRRSKHYKKGSSKRNRTKRVKQ